MYLQMSQSECLLDPQTGNSEYKTSRYQPNKSHSTQHYDFSSLVASDPKEGRVMVEGEVSTNGRWLANCRLNRSLPLE